MSQANSSVTVRLEAGTHWICACGLAKNFPYCDDTHKGTEFQPLALELSASKVVEISK